MPLAFEIERFDWTGDDRLEVSGHWFDVAGRRFIRPTLHLRVNGRRRRLIALLDEKPWDPDQPLWTAAFGWRGPRTGVAAARLEVSPDIVLDLPVPGAGAAGRSVTPRPKRLPKRQPREEPRPEPAPEPPPPLPREEAAAPEPPPAAVAAPPRPETPRLAAPDLVVGALERRLAAAERAVAEARREVAALMEHQASAVERAREVVELEGRLAAAMEELERVQTDVEPLERRLPIRRGDWARGTRTAVGLVLVVLFALFVLLVVVIF